MITTKSEDYIERFEYDFNSEIFSGLTDDGRKFRPQVWLRDQCTLQALVRHNMSKMFGSFYRQTHPIHLKWAMVVYRNNQWRMDLNAKRTEFLWGGEWTYSEE